MPAKAGILFCEKMMKSIPMKEKSCRKAASFIIWII